MTDQQLRYLAHQETIRSNRAVENLKDEELAERARANLATEALRARSVSLDETKFVTQVVKDVLDALYHSPDDYTTLVKGLVGKL